MQYAVCSMPTSSTGVSIAVPVAFEYGYSKVLIRDDKLLAIHQISYIGEVLGMHRIGSAYPDFLNFLNHVHCELMVGSLQELSTQSHHGRYSW